MVLLDEWTYSTRTFKVANGLFWATFLLVTIAFSTPYWLISIPDDELPNPKFTNLGLWVYCFNGFFDMRHQYERKFYNCLHILQEDYDIIRDEIQPPFMVATQFFYTLGYMGFLVAIIMLLMYFFCISNYYRASLLKWLGINLIITGIACAIAVIIFGAKGDGRDFMPEWEHNYHGWSYALAATCIVLTWANAILFIVEARRSKRWQQAREKQVTVEGETI